MKKLKVMVAGLLLATTVLAFNPMRANAYDGTNWVHRSNGWRYELSSTWFLVGWQMIGVDWYYFDINGIMAHDTTIQGYSVGSDGKWVNDPIFLCADNNLEHLIMNQVGRTYGDLRKDEVLGIIKFQAINANVSTLDGIENLKNLTSLRVDDDNLYGIDTVYELKNLTNLCVRSHKLTDVDKIISTVSQLPNLKTLWLDGNNFTTADKQRLANAVPNVYTTYDYIN